VSAAQQLDLDEVFGGLPLKPKKRKANPREEMCRCGCELRGHAGKKHGGACSRCGQCKRGRPMKRRPVEIPAHLCPPNGAIILERETEKQKLVRTFGWALLEPHICNGRCAYDASYCAPTKLTIYLSQLRTKSPNDFQAPQRNTRWRNMAIDADYKETCSGRAMMAIADAGVASFGRPSSIKLTRISTGKIDRHDNVRGALKYVVDGIAEALGFNDAELADSPSRAGTIPITYERESPHRRGVRGVRIELTWKGTP